MATKESGNKTSNWEKAKNVITAVNVTNAFKKSLEEAKIEERLATKLHRVLQSIVLYREEKALVEASLSECHIMLSGPPRVGKSTLINALCGSEVARTSDGLASCTQRVECYTKTTERYNRKYIVKFWDTVGIESWTKPDIESYVCDIIKIRHPICLIFCASPGCYVDLERLFWLVTTCIDSNIFCALVCTNMHFGNRTDSVLQDLNDIFLRLSQEKYPLISEKVDSSNSSTPSITFYSNKKTRQRVALVSQINTIEYVDLSKNIRLPPVGVFELITGIMDSLSEEKIEQMVEIILNNRSFWTRINQTLSGFWNERFLQSFRSWFAIQ
ncbi:unnamed protein product [Rotaria sp. Silwood1]|nr:unnamed protein product [Rotaria sp. Silwood1]CAF5026220.1 unnamed protein product [Rotaria sp. Silwood1]